MADLSIGTFYHGTADPSNVSGFRYACESFLTGLLACEEIVKLHVFAIDLSAEKRARFHDLYLRSEGAAERCELSDLGSVAGVRSLREATLDILHEMEARPHRALAGRAALQAGPVPLSIWMHGNRIGARALFGFYLPFLLGGFRSGDAIICASQASRTALLRHLDHLRAFILRAHGVDLTFQGAVELIPFGVDADLFAPRSREEARRDLGLHPGAAIVLSHGRVNLTNKQDLSPLLLAFRRCLRRQGGERARLLISTSEERPDLALLRERARHLGISQAVDVLVGLERERVPLLYAASDVVVCLSDTLIENFGLTALEAMSCGVPVVAAEWAGFRETVVHGETGFLIPSMWSEHEEDLDLLDAMDAAVGPAMAAQSISADCDALEQAIAVLLSDRALAARLGEAGRRRVLERYTVRTMIQRHLELFREMIERARSAPPSAGSGSGVPPLPMVHAFAAYPSRFLRDQDVVELSDDGRALLGGAEVVCIPPVAGRPIEEDAISALIRAVLAHPAGGCSVAQVLSHAGRHGALPRDKARRHLMWLIKQGYLRLRG